jgi:hypothetical protein
MTTERVAGAVALALSAVVGIATIAHVVQLATIVARGRLAQTTFEVRDGVAIYGEMIGPGGVTLEAVVAGFVTDATILAVVALLIVIGSSLVRGAPFGGRTTAAVAATGAVIAVGGTVAAAISSFADRHNASLLPYFTGGAVPGALEVPLLSLVTVSLLPLVAGLTIVMLAFVFGAGARIQRDTRGLV